MTRLPTFQQMRGEAERAVATAQEHLRSDWADGRGPTPEQAQALQRARAALAEAKTALGEAARQ